MSLVYAIYEALNFDKKCVSEFFILSYKEVYEKKYN